MTIMEEKLVLTVSGFSEQYEFTNHYYHDLKQKQQSRGYDFGYVLVLLPKEENTHCSACFCVYTRTKVAAVNTV